MICGEVFRPPGAPARVCIEPWGTDHTHCLEAPDAPRTRRLDRYECTYFDLASDVELIETSERRP